MSKMHEIHFMEQFHNHEHHPEIEHSRRIYDDVGPVGPPVTPNTFKRGGTVNHKQHMLVESALNIASKKGGMR